MLHPLYCCKLSFTKVDDVDENGKPIKRYASGRISTTGLVSPLYGFFEARYPRTQQSLKVAVSGISAWIPV